MKRIREDELANDFLNKAIQMNKESLLYSEGIFDNDYYLLLLSSITFCLMVE